MSFCDGLISLHIFSVFIHVVWQNNIPLFGYTTFCLSIHLLMHMWAAFIFWLLWMTLQWTLVCRHLFTSLLSIPLGIYLGGKLLGCWVILCFAFWGKGKLFSTMAIAFYTFPNTSCFLYFFFLIAILVVVKWYLILVFI